MVIPSHFAVDFDSVRYQVRTKLAELGLQYVEIKRLDSEKAQKILMQMTRIRLWTRALDYSEFLTQTQKYRITYQLIEFSDIYDFPTAPVLAERERPDILIGGGGSTIINNITYDAGTPFSATANTGASTIVSIPFTSSSGAMYTFTVTDGSANQRSGVITATWLPDGSLVNNSETDSGDIGDTSDVVLSIDSSAGNIRLRATSSSNGWSVSGKYYLI